VTDWQRGEVCIPVPPLGGDRPHCTKELDMRQRLTFPGMAVLLACTMGPQVAAAQTPAADPSARLQAVLPADVYTKVEARIAAARARQLPAAALEHRALELAAKRATPEQVEQGVDSFATHLEKGRSALMKGGRQHPTDGETEAAADALAQGVDGASVSALAKSAPSGRSLAVPLYVMSSLVARGLPSDAALTKVQARLQAKASDQALMQETGPANADHGASAAPHGAPTLPAAAESHRPATAGQPAAVPSNPGSTHRPASAPAPRSQHPH
jgi:hypothetical protein